MGRELSLSRKITSNKTWEQTSRAALSPACTAPLMKPLHSVAVSVPAKWILMKKTNRKKHVQNPIHIALTIHFFNIDHLAPQMKTLRPLGHLR